MACEDFHDLVLARELEFLQPLLLDLLLRRQVQLALQGSQLPFEVGVLVVVAPQLRLAFEQGDDQLLVLDLHSHTSAIEGPRR